MRKLHVQSGWFNGDDAESATIYAQKAEPNEVYVEIQATADYLGYADERPRAGVHLNPVDALEFAEQVRQSALAALPKAATAER